MSTLYVSPTGSDTNSGASVAQSLRTIAAARALAVSGDTVLVDGDTNTPYREAVVAKAGVTHSTRAGTRPCIDGAAFGATPLRRSG